MRNNHLGPTASFSHLPFTKDTIYDSNKAIIRILGLHIERLRHEKGLSYETVGKRTGCSDTTVYRICKGTMEFCGISLLSKLALSFGYTLEDLLLAPIADKNAFGVSSKKH